jgi:hypothetical protein
MKPAALLSSLFLCLVALAHLARLIFGIGIVVDHYVVPAWPSMIAVVGPGFLAIWLWREQRPTHS